MTDHPQRYEIENWAGSPGDYETPEQYAGVVQAIIDSGTTDEADWLAIMEQVTGTLDLRALADAAARAYNTYDELRLRLHAGIRQATAAGMSEAEAARVSGVSRMTVRNARGKA